MKKNGLKFNVVDLNNGKGIKNATFELRQNDILVTSSASDINGLVKFNKVFPGYYSLIQTTTDSNHIINENIFNLLIEENKILINGNMTNFVIKNKRRQ